jgi:hypothetical protein
VKHLGKGQTRGNRDEQAGKNPGCRKSTATGKTYERFGRQKSLVEQNRLNASPSSLEQSNLGDSQDMDKN